MNHYFLSGCGLWVGQFPKPKPAQQKTAEQPRASEATWKEYRASAFYYPGPVFFLHRLSSQSVIVNLKRMRKEKGFMP